MGRAANESGTGVAVPSFPSRRGEQIPLFAQKDNLRSAVVDFWIGERQKQKLLTAKGAKRTQRWQRTRRWQAKKSGLSVATLISTPNPVSQVLW